MDIKAAVIAVCLLFSGYLFYNDQKRDAVIFDLSTKLQAALAKGGTGINDNDLMDAIRAQVRSEIAARPAADCKGGSQADLTRLQELQIRLESFDKKFNLALAKLTSPDAGKEEEERIARKANKIRDKIIALCKK